MTVRIQAGRKPDHFTKTVQNNDLAVAQSPYDHVETIRAEIDCRNDLRVLARLLTPIGF